MTEEQLVALEMLIKTMNAGEQIELMSQFVKTLSLTYDARIRLLTAIQNRLKNLEFEISQKVWEQKLLIQELES